MREASRVHARGERPYAYIESPAVSGFAHHLDMPDLSNFNPKAPAPMTADKLTVQKATRSGVEAWLDDAWQSGAAPFDRDVINLREALEAVYDANARKAAESSNLCLELGCALCPCGARGRAACGCLPGEYRASEGGAVLGARDCARCAKRIREGSARWCRRQHGP